MVDWNKSGFYKAYCKCKENEKAPLGDYTKPENQYDLETVSNLPEFCGVLTDDAVMFDADDQINSELLYKIITGENHKCLVTDRKGGQGIHATYLNAMGLIEKQATKVMLACGVIVDIKPGSKKGVDCLKFQSVERNIIYDIEEHESYQDAPKYFMPIKTKIDFAQMGEGSGRNQTLYNYILTLQSNDFTVEEIRETTRIINKYVLKSPLSDREIETILRDDSFKKQSFFRRTKFLHEKFAAYMKNNHHMIKLDGKLNIYTDGIYVSEGNEIEKNMIKHIPSLTDAQRREVLKHLILICEDRQAADLHLVAFKNGIYNVRDDSFSDFTPNVIITNKINWNYNPSTYSELAEKTLNKLSCNDPDIRMLLEEVIGYTFYRRNELGKAFILLGDKQNGKSTYIDMVKTTLGDGNISALDLKNLSDRFNKAMLYKKMANLGDDIDDGFITDTSTFKKVVTGDTMQGENKGEKPFNFNPYCKLIFSANRIPKVKDSTGATIRRLIIIPFNARFTDKESDYDPYIKYKLRETECVEYLILLGIQGLKRILQNRKFTISNDVEKELREYQKYNDSVSGFLSECEAEDIKVIDETTVQVFNNYRIYCSRNNYDVLAYNEFSKQLQKITGFETSRRTIDGRKYSIYVAEK